ncbi:MAG: MFS transporter [Pseudomonadota bacterium]|jgi:MFS family permease|uniref:MFS transporter n=1 Tax=Sulfuricystis thermophila TaxID=2496847 RepID=UPI00103665AE|nr:MFS transporter [Sulfuricystis thermophila]MDI6750737.1 MFS transporter [Rhodocyclaceae bacterium]
MLALSRRFPAFQSRNFRLFFAGQLVSLIGTWMQHIAMTWLAYRLTDSTVMLGLVGFSSQLPILLFSIPAGVWNDRLDRRRLLILTQFLALLQALLLAGLTATATITPALLLALAFTLGCINAVDLPARQAFVAQMVPDKRALPNAIGLNSFLMNGSRFVGPALAGLVVATAGEAACFLLNALSYLAVLAALAAIRTVPGKPPARQSALDALRDGLIYTIRHPRIRLTLLLIACFSFFVTPYVVMMPVYARDLFHGDARTYGLLISSAGAGSLCAALWLAWRGGKRAGDGLDRLVGRTAVTGGIMLAAFAYLPKIEFAYPLLMLLGFSVVITAAGSNTLIQLEVEEHFRGRVMAIFSTAFLGIAPLGSLMVGLVSAHLDVRSTLFGCGLLAFGAGLVFRRRIHAHQ